MSGSAPKTDEKQISATLTVAPTRFRRIGQRGRRWDLPRTFAGYYSDTNASVLGAAPKYVLKSARPNDPQYIVKYAEKHGQRETLTELFINELGLALGLNSAHGGIILSDTEPTFLSRIFLAPDERLIHGSLIIEDCFKREAASDAHELERIHHRTEQEFYSIDLIVEVLRNFCGIDFDSVRRPFFEMLVFDALVGAMDRHSQNWGVITKGTEPARYRFSPIFDTARALLWSLDEVHLESMCGEDEDNQTPEHLARFEKKLERYVESSRPCMGPERKKLGRGVCNHFQFVQNLIELYREPTIQALASLTRGVEAKAARLLKQFPYKMGFTGKRKRLILKVLEMRANRLRAILRKEQVSETLGLSV